jgi:hypothetical protein
MKDYYQILGVSNKAGSLEIKRAYRKLAVLYHPDKNPDPAAEVFFKEVNEAYDILSDDSKRRDYDFQIQNPFSNIVLPVDPKPYHRDPAYHRRRSHGYQGKPTVEDLMALYLPYFKWLIWAGLGVMMMFFIDYLLPTQTSLEPIREIYSGPRKTTYDIIETSNDRKIRVYNGEGSFFMHEASIVVEYTPLLQAVVSVSDVSERKKFALGGIYSAVFIFPLALFIVSIIGFFLRNNIVYAFNISVTNGVLILLVIYLILNT